jgi:iron(III) transport system permease protein
LIVLCLVCVALEFRVRGAARYARYARADRGTRRALRRYPLGGWRWFVVVCFALLSIVTIGVPLGMISYWLTQHGDAATTPIEVSPALIFGAAGSSLGYGLGAAVVTTTLALPLAFLLVRYPGRVGIVLERIVFLAQGVPGLVIALALVSLAVHALRPFYQSTALLVVAYAILSLPLALVSVRAALAQVPTGLEEASRSLGLGWMQTLRRVQLPLVSSGLGAAATMVFISVVTELNATLLLSPVDTHTLATQVWSDTATFAFAAAAPYAAVLVAMSLGASALLFALLGRSALPAESK